MCSMCTAFHFCRYNFSHKKWCIWNISWWKRTIQGRTNLIYIPLPVCVVTLHFPFVRRHVSPLSSSDDVFPWSDRRSGELHSGAHRTVYAVSLVVSPNGMVYVCIYSLCILRFTHVLVCAVGGTCIYPLKRIYANTYQLYRNPILCNCCNRSCTV